MILRRPSKWRYIHGRSSDFTHTPPLSERGPTQIADRQSLRMPSTLSMTVGDLGVRPRRLHISVFTTICARRNSPSRLLPRSVAFLPFSSFSFLGPIWASFKGKELCRELWMERKSIHQNNSKRIRLTLSSSSLFSFSSSFFVVFVVFIPRADRGVV